MSVKTPKCCMYEAVVSVVKIRGEPVGLFKILDYMDTLRVMNDSPRFRDSVIKNIIVDSCRTGCSHGSQICKEGNKKRGNRKRGAVRKMTNVNKARSLRSEIHYEYEILSDIHHKLDFGCCSAI